MTISMTVKSNILKDLVNKLLTNGVQLELNSMHRDIRIFNATQWMYLKGKDEYLISFSTLNEEIVIQKDNIEQLCIGN